MEKIPIKSIAIAGCYTIKCGKVQEEWILWQGTVDVNLDTFRILVLIVALVRFLIAADVSLIVCDSVCMLTFHLAISALVWYYFT